MKIESKKKKKEKRGRGGRKVEKKGRKRGERNERMNERWRMIFIAENAATMRPLDVPGRGEPVFDSFFRVFPIQY